MANDLYSEKEAEQRREAALKRMLATPPKPRVAREIKKAKPPKPKAKKR